MTPEKSYRLALGDPKKFNRKKTQAEKIIATDAYYSYVYAVNVLYDRFELGENIIINNRNRHIICCYCYLIKNTYKIVPFHYKFI